MSQSDQCKNCPHNKHDETIKGLRNQIGFFIDKHTNLNKKFMQEKSEYLALKAQMDWNHEPDPEVDLIRAIEMIGDESHHVKTCSSHILYPFQVVDLKEGKYTVCFMCGKLIRPEDIKD